MITITDEALSKAIERTKADGRDTIRLGITGGGGAGYEYVFKFDEATVHDYIVDHGEIKFAIDPQSIAYLDGSTLTWEVLGLNEQFKLINPKEQSACGCGVSIQFDDRQIQNYKAL